MSLDETLNVFGVEVIVFLQRNFMKWSSFFVDVSHYGDPSLAFNFYFPLATALCLQTGVALLWTLIISEWTNMILKWILAGHRPFWWVHESPYYLNKALPKVRQFPITCETGPGMPSGHSTLNAALFFILVKALTNHFEPLLRSRFGEKVSIRITRGTWAAYAFWIALVMTSRTFIAAHFPHQCFLGAFIGIATALWVSSTKILTIKTNGRAVILTGVILGSVGGVFGIYRILGNDPMWAMGKAVRWCVDINYINIDSIPFYSMSRFSGLALGLGLSLASHYYQQISQTTFTTKMRLSLLILSLTVGQTSTFIHRLLPSTIMGYYVFEFILNSVFVYVIIALLPKFVMVASGAKPKPKPKTRMNKDKAK